MSDNDENLEQAFDQLTGELTKIILQTVFLNLQVWNQDPYSPIMKLLVGRALHGALTRLLLLEGQLYMGSN